MYTDTPENMKESVFLTLDMEIAHKLCPLAISAQIENDIGRGV